MGTERGGRSIRHTVNEKMEEFDGSACFSLEEEPVPDEVVLKVFKTTLNEFRNRDRYIKDDYRFIDRFSKLNPRKIIRLWAEKEMHNLGR